MALFHSLVVALDGSAQSDAASALAIKIAAAQKAHILFVNVVEAEKVVASIVPGQGFADPTLAIDQLRSAGAEALRKALADAQSAGVTATSKLDEGDSVERIIELAKSNGADLIVMGSHGRAGLDRLLLGSVAEGVLRKSTIPVMIAKS